MGTASPFGYVGESVFTLLEKLRPYTRPSWKEHLRQVVRFTGELLNQGASRATALEGFAQSPEFQEIMARYGL